MIELDMIVRYVVRCRLSGSGRSLWERNAKLPYFNSHFYCVLWWYIQPFLLSFHFAKVASTVVTGAFYDLAVHVVGLFWNVHRLVSHTVLTLREQALSLTY